MKFAVLVFPGSNCDIDMYHAIKDELGEEVEYVWHTATDLSGFDGVLVPGGFSYGDYLRCGAMANQSNIMAEVKKAADAGKPVLGVCNGFQILTEAGLLPGALLRNKNLKFMCRTVQLKVENNNTLFTNQYEQGQIINIPIAHGEGNYYCDEETLQSLKDNNQIVFTYSGDNPNGSLEDIAGIINERGNVLGMMPHPERAVDALVGGADGLAVFKSIVKQWRKIMSTTKFEPTAQQIKDEKLYAGMGMSDEEFAMVEGILGRLPNWTETGLFSVMWSEHCSYKNSKPVLRKFPTKGHKYYKVQVKVRVLSILVMNRQ